MSQRVCAMRSSALQQMGCAEHPVSDAATSGLKIPQNEEGGHDDAQPPASRARLEALSSLMHGDLGWATGTSVEMCWKQSAFLTL